MRAFSLLGEVESLRFLMQKVHTKKGAPLMGIRLLNARRGRPGLGKAGSVCCCQKDSSSALRCAGFGETLAAETGSTSVPMELAMQSFFSSKGSMSRNPRCVQTALDRAMNPCYGGCQGAW